MSQKSQESCWQSQRFLKRDQPALFEAAMLIRTEVFVVEQGVPAEAEQDDLDEVAYHYLLNESQSPQDYLATGRVVIQRHNDDQASFQVIGKIGRVAVLLSQRGKGLGKVMMQAMMTDARQLGVTQFALHAQTHALGFYEQLGFQPIGEPFLEEGILHRKMFCPVTQTHSYIRKNAHNPNVSLNHNETFFEL